MRPSREEYFLGIVKLVAERATCVRRKVGCILVNSRGEVLATGYNGVPKGMLHCTDFPCEGANLPSGTGLDVCQAVHAEANALLQCKDIWDIQTAYITVAPCVHCVKLLMNTSCQRIVFSGDYPHSEASEKLWTNQGRTWLRWA